MPLILCISPIIIGKNMFKSGILYGVSNPTPGLVYLHSLHKTNTLLYLARCCRQLPQLHLNRSEPSGYKSFWRKGRTHYYLKIHYSQNQFLVCNHLHLPQPFLHIVLKGIAAISPVSPPGDVIVDVLHYLPG